MPTNASFDATSQQAQFQPQFDWHFSLGSSCDECLSIFCPPHRLQRTQILAASPLTRQPSAAV